MLVGFAVCGDEPPGCFPPPAPALLAQAGLIEVMAGARQASCAPADGHSARFEIGLDGVAAQSGHLTVQVRPLVMRRHPGIQPERSQRRQNGSVGGHDHIAGTFTRTVVR